MAQLGGLPAFDRVHFLICWTLGAVAGFVLVQAAIKKNAAVLHHVEEAAAVMLAENPVVCSLSLSVSRC